MEEFTGLYRGNNTTFYIDRLHPEIPWTLVVFDQRSDRQAVVTLLFTIAMIISAGTVFLTGLLLILLS